MSATAQPAIAYPPGWYFDPAAQIHRYWDGNAWTNHVAPVGLVLPEEPKPATGDWIGAVLLPLLMPAIGLVAGLIWTLIGGTKRQPGMVCLGASAAMIVVWILAMGTNG